ncbi:MAG: DUF3857 and transglutaminase domain-containing protein [Acidobacteriota bacterium]|nr:MAG: DUF3857 and transglutaminase domain-containing protein [Acidobacteriota bacterium]
MIQRSRSVTLALLLLSVFAFSQESGWRPVSAEDLSSTSSVVEPNADAEVLLWDVWVEDDYQRRAGYKSILYHYLRTKIFTDRGREEHSKVSLPFGTIPGYPGKVSIQDIEARTIAPDGKISVLDGKDIFEQEVVKGDGVKVMAKSFVMPDVSAGSVIEYRWKEVRSDAISMYVRLQLSREIPVRVVSYHLKPVSHPWLAMRIRTFNTYARFKEESDGFYGTSVTNVRSFKEEPFMPPEYDTRPWLLVYYADEESDTGLTPDEYWRNKGRSTYEVHESIFKKKKEIRQAAAEIVGDTSDPLEKVKRIWEFCKRDIKNLGDDALALTDKQREGFKDNKSESDTLKRKHGYWHDIHMLFAALVNAAGLDVRIANVTLRSNPGFDSSLLNDYLLETEMVAVKIAGRWTLFEPSDQHLPFGMIPWSREGERALISDADELIWIELPASEADQSKQKRTVRMELGPDGSLTGDAVIEFSGHQAAAYKERLDDDSPNEREDAVRSFVKARISEVAEVSDISIENLEDSDMPLVYRFRLRVPDYAQRTGRRMFLVPNVFANAAKPVFQTAERVNDIFFQYPWSEEDDFEIRLPEGFSVESAEPADPVNDTGKLGSHRTEIAVSADGLLNYRRYFEFGSPGNLEFSSSSYRRLKDLFDAYHSADQKAVTLMRPETP